MATWKCNSCGTVYSDTLQNGVLFFHVCHPEVIEHGTFDKHGNVITPEKRTPRPDIRNENMRPGLQYIDGKYWVGVPLAEDPKFLILQPAVELIISEGLGRTLVE